MRKLTAILILVMAFTGAVQAAQKWESFTFSDDINAGLETLKSYCLTHDVQLGDVLWANKLDSEADIKSGMSIMLPANQADMLAIWQHVGAWQPTALVPVTSGAAARRLVEPETKVTHANISLSAIAKAEAEKAEPLQPKNVQTSANTPSLDIMSNIPAQVVYAQQAKTPAVTPAPEVKTPEVKPVTPAATDTLATAPAPKPAPAAKKPAKSSQPSPAKVIAQTAKPDKILTAKPKPKAEIPGLMDPIIILSPNGDPTAGPMRLIISGDKVEVVQLPQSAAPKRPSVADANTPFSSGWSSYMSHYSTIPTPKVSPNNRLTNLNTLNGKMMWPVDGKISSPFGKWRGKHQHQGIDIPMPAGTPIRAARNGTVSRTGNNSTIGFRGYGNFVLLEHGGGVKTFYAHCSKVAVAEGQRIMQGQIIAYVGSTGRSTANHLHFEVRINDTKVNPMPYLAGNTHLASTK